MTGDYVDDLPADVREIIEQFERDLEDLRREADDRANSVRQKVEKKISKLQQDADEQVLTVMEEIEKRVQEMRERLASELKPLQESVLKEGRLDEALAIREQLRLLKKLASVGLASGPVQPDPGSLVDFGGQIGQTLLFDVAGNRDGPLWGTDVYTADSNLGTAAVHAGVLRSGEQGVIRVTMVDTGSQPSFQGTNRNGVASASWGPYGLGFRVARR
jgi:hypothetical protein